jgi:aspartate kinase
MAIVVHKYGGTSVGSVERIRAIADRVIRAHQAGDRLLIVVSAMGETTDQLMEMARQITDQPNQRELDMLLTAGERITMALLALTLQARGVRAVSFTGSQSGIITDERHGRARITEIRPFRLRESLDQGAIVIVAGFQGVSREKEVTTLGRGGSDTTGVALAAAFDAQCIIYTDVAGVYTADPRVVPNARLIPRIDCHTLSQLAHLGSQVVHARSVDLAAKFRIPLEVRCSFDEEEGTVVVHDNALEGPAVRAVAQAKRVQWMEVESKESGEQTVSSLLSKLSELDVPLDLLSLEKTSNGTRVTWPLSPSETERFRGAWEAEAKPKEGWRLVVGPEKSLVSIVGLELCSDADVALSAAGALAQNGIGIHAMRSSSSSVSFAVDADRAEDAVRILHEVFVEK